MIDPTQQPPMMAPQGAPPGMGPAGPSPMAPAMGALFAQMANLAQNMPRTAMDKVREAVKLLGEARDEDDKLGHLSLAMGIIKDGPDSMEKRFGNGSPSDQPKSRKTSE